MTGSEQANGACDNARVSRIAELNDELRRSQSNGQIVITRGVRLFPGFDPQTLLRLLAEYHAFDADNDPHGEHDFGDIELAGQSLLWKIDYFDLHLRYGSPDPADPKVTRRVLTVMLPEEW